MTHGHSRLRTYVATLGIVCMTVGQPSLAAADAPIWCSPDGLDSNGQPFPPRPYWGQLDQVPDYVDVMNNFNIAKSIKLLISAMEKSLALLQEVTSDGGDSDVDGWCLCNCTYDAAWWVSYITTTLKNNLIQAVYDAKNDYVDALVTKLQALKQVVLDTLPAFKADVEQAIIDACMLATGTECDTVSGTLNDMASDFADVITSEVESIFNAEKDQVLELLTGVGSPYALGMEQIQAQLADVGAAAAEILKLNFKPLGQELSELMTITGDVIGDVLDGAKAIAQSYTSGDVLAWKNQVLAAAQAQIGTYFTNSAAAWAQLQVDIDAAVDARIDAIKNAIDDVYVTATNYQGPFNTFKSSLTSGIIANLTNVGGCYGHSKRSECTVDPGGFCEGTTPGTVGGSGGIDTPVWFPTEVFKDGKTALLFALKHIGFLEKVNAFLQNNAPAWMGTIGTWIDGLKNAADVLDKVSKYINTFTDGFHLGTYSDIRPDLHMCVGYAGHGALAQIFTFNVGDHVVSGGASYASHNLTKNHRAQFRSGGFAVDIDGKTLQLAPGISLNTQMDGWRMWDKKYPFGLGRNADGSFWNTINPGNWSFSTMAVDKYDLFNLVDQTELEALCPGGVGPCNLTLANFLYNGFFPVDYTVGTTGYEWPRLGVEWEEDLNAIAVFGAGLNLEFQMKTYRWDITPSILLFAPPPVWLTPWLSLDAGANWLYEANYLRETLQEKLNANLPASDQLSANDFRRDKYPADSVSYNGEPFQAPDVTEDMGTGAYVEPKVGADLDIGIKIAKFLKIGITASIYLGLKVDVGGYGGILDLNRALIDALQASNPPGDDCHVVVENEIESYCTNELYQKDEPCKDDPDCIDESPGSPNQGPYSTGTYECEGDKKNCTQFGYCLNADGDVTAHDIKRDDCEREQGQTGCVAVYAENPCGCGALCQADINNIPPHPPIGFCNTEASQSHLATLLAIVQNEATILKTPEECMAMGWCYNWGYRPGIEELDYIPVYTGVAPQPGACPPAIDQNGNAIVDATGNPIPSQWVPFQWNGGGSAGAPSGVWYPYQCATRTTPVVTGWTGPDCNPIEFGYPSACGCFDDANCAGTCEEGTCSEHASVPCACNPTGGGTCPSGRTCVEGACLLDCTTDLDCGPSRVCDAGGCVMENGVPFAEQIIWKMRTVEEPMHAVASYALNKLVVSAVLGVGITIGAQYKIFKKWREKVLWKWNDDFPLLELPWVKHQLGLEAQYQDDCDALMGTMTNHQPGQVTRPVALPNGTPSSELVQWCKPSMADNVSNPPSPDDPGDVIGGLEDVHDWGYDLGLDFWYKHQMCIDGVVWYEYFANLHENPEDVWALLECTYYGFDATHELDCSGPQELLGSLMTALGCLDADGAGASFMNKLLFKHLQNAGLTAFYTTTYVPMVGGVPSGPARTVLDWSAIFLDLEEALTASNVQFAILGFNGLAPFGPLTPKFYITAWLAELDTCIDDAEAGGKYIDANLDMTIGITEADFEPCGDPCDGDNPDPALCPSLGACCKPDGQCAYTSDKTCTFVGGSFQLGATCGLLACQPASSTGACCTASGCIPTATASLCAAQGGSFQPGQSCADVFQCEGIWACCIPSNGCVMATSAACAKAKGAFRAGQTCADVGFCEEPLGSCCKPDGDCDILTATKCTAEGGSWSAGAHCALPGYCAAINTGACCLPTGCNTTSATSCLAAIQQQGAGNFSPGQTCAQVNCDVMGGCCQPDGTCSQMPQTLCQALGGTAAGPSCMAPTTCPQPGDAWACCLPSGACSNLTAGQCSAVGGMLTVGATCSQVGGMCQPQGAACCLPDGTCANLAHDTCLGLGGSPYPTVTCGIAGTPAFQCPVLEPTGGCCFPTGACKDTTAAQCTELQGAFHLGVPCSSADLVCIDMTAPSACCLPGYGCDMIVPEACSAAGGVPHPGHTCSQVICKVTAFSGACCIDGICKNISNLACKLRNGVFHANQLCSSTLCSQPMGACCLGDSCEQLTAPYCAKKQKLLGVSGGFYPGMSCNAIPCGKLGACCLQSDECVQTTWDKCTASSGSFALGAACDAVDCCPAPPIGACCVDGQCYELPEDHCGALGGAWKPNLTCDEAQCCGQQMPTVACCLQSKCVNLSAAVCNALGGAAGGPGTVCQGIKGKSCLIAFPEIISTPATAGTSTQAFDAGTESVLPVK